MREFSVTSLYSATSSSFLNTTPASGRANVFLTGHRNAHLMLPLHNAIVDEFVYH